ncbi:MAG: SbcC/MukB-like Walker B domain-containing protein, partial [Nocardioidaceae bacterium]
CELADCDQELAALSAASEGADAAIAAARLTSLRQELHQAEATAGQVVALADSLGELERTTANTRRHCQQLATSVGQLTERCTLLTGRRDQLVRELAAVVGEDRTLTEALQASRHRIDLLERLLESIRDHQGALRDGERSAQRLAEAVADAGFPDADAARAAVMSRTDISNAETLLRRRADQEAQVRSVLDDPQVVDAAAAAAVDLTGVTARLEQAQRERDQAVTNEQTFDRRARRLDTLHDSLGQALTEWRPVRDSLGVAERMAALCAGTSVDNRHRMRLSAFVLAARLGQVVAAANARLLRMTSGRYTLQHSVARGVGDKRGGLGLQVHDGWTGESRDPATLSGGETFLASLALALGLADVVTHESGGTEIRTLFVDEGFGSLDPETLDDVMDVLDQLRSGGRAVGIVSHVVDLRARVPAQMHVHKARDGSSLSHA